MTEHAELPWKGPLQSRDCTERNIIDDADGNSLFLIVGIAAQSRGKRKRIGDTVVRACNNHEDLVAACEWIGKFILTASDGGNAWCAVRGQPGAKEWAEGLKAAIEGAKPK